MKFVFFHLMPYPYLPDDFDERFATPSLTYPNGHFDRRSASSSTTATSTSSSTPTKLGFDGICVNEHHQTAYGMMPSPNIMAAALARRTKQREGHGPRQRDRAPRPSRCGSPRRSRCSTTSRDGRLVSGFVRGIGWEYFDHGAQPRRTRASASTRPTT